MDRQWVFEMVNSTPTEHAEQCHLMTWVRLHEHKWPVLRRLFAVPNGGNRNKITAYQLMMEGVKPGVPDLFLPAACGGYHGLWIELKRRKGGQLTMHQKDWLEYLQKAGYRAEVCKGWEEAQTVLEEYLESK